MCASVSEQRRRRLAVKIEEEDKNKKLNEWGVCIDLYNHQKNSVLRMEWMEKNRKRNYATQNSSCVVESNFGILNDKVGSGKTLMCVSFLSREAMTENYRTESSTREFVELISCYGNDVYRCKTVTKKTVKYYPVTIVIVPNSIVFQWRDELIKTNMSFKIVTTNKQIDDFKNYVERVNVIVVTKTLYTEFHRASERVMMSGGDYCFKRLIVDEYVSRGGFRKMSADFVWLVTATLPKIYNFTSAMTKCNFINYCLGSSGRKRGYLTHYDWTFVTVKNTDECINASFIVAEIRNVTYICEGTTDSLISMKAEVSEEIRRMIYADNIRGAIEAYGGNIETDSLLAVIIRKEESDIKKIKASIVYHNSLSEEDRKNEYIQKLEIAEKKLENIREKVQRDEQENECVLCCIDIVEKCLIQCCKSIMCGKCFSHLLKNDKPCPFCRGELNLGNVIMSSKEKYKKPVKKEKLKTKCENIVDIINGNAGGKFLIFSEFYETSSVIQSALKSLNIKYDEIKGTVQHKKNVLERYRFGDLNVIFLNARVDGSGINLPETTDIILYHKITSPNLESQIVGRALRLGRTKPLKIHRLMYREEYHLRDVDPSVNYLHQHNEAESSDNNAAEDEESEGEGNDDIINQIDADYRLALRLHNEQ